MEPTIKNELPSIPRGWQRTINFVSSFVFYGLLLLVFRVIQPDLDEHILISEGMWNNWKVPAHPFFYFLIQLLSGFSNYFEAELMAAFLIFAGVQALKIEMACKLVETVSKTTLNWISYACVFMVCWLINPNFPEKSFIINQIEPNYFHNGTLQLSLPFALWLIRELFLFSEKEDAPAIGTILLSGLLTGLCKPSILFCIIPVFPLVIFLRKGLSVHLLRSLQVSLLFTFLIMGQSSYLRMNPPNYVTSFKLLFKPFFQFGDLTGHLKMLFYSSLIPSLFIIIHRGILKNQFIIFLLLLHGCGLVISMTLVDSINGVLFNNMTWQSSVTTFLLLLSTVGLFFQNQKIRPLLKKLMLVFISINLIYSAWYFFNVVIYRTFFI